METIEMLIAILGPTIVILIFTAKMYFEILQRLTAVETNVTMLISWVACLNGEMSNEKEFHDFLKKLKEVNRENCKNQKCD